MKRQRIIYDPHNDHYQRLGVPPRASTQDIQKAYRKLAKQLHPDVQATRGQDTTAEFQLLNDAYAVLSDPLKRREYDQQRLPKARGSKGKATYRGPRPVAGDEWWNVPHEAQPGYSGIKSRPAQRSVSPKARRVLAGAWLERAKLGFLRPLYSEIVDLIRSPYRYVLGATTLVLFAMVGALIIGIASQAAIDDSAASEASIDESILTFLPDSIAEGFIPTQAVRETVPFSPCPSEFRLSIEEIEFLETATTKLTAIGLVSFLVDDATIVQVEEPMDDRQLTIVGEPRSVELNIVPPTGAFKFNEQVETSAYEAGRWRLQWTPILPNGTRQATCDQLMTIIVP